MSTCNVDVRWFPFDIQKCELKFGSWTYDGWLLDLQMTDADISGYMPNGEWDLIGKKEKKKHPKKPLLMNNWSKFLWLHSFRCSWHQKWGFLRLLQGAVPRRDVRDHDPEADALLRPEPAHPLRAAFLHDPADLRAASRLRREDFTGWVDQSGRTVKLLGFTPTSGRCKQRGNTSKSNAK